MKYIKYFKYTKQEFKQGRDFAILVLSSALVLIGEQFFSQSIWMSAIIYIIGFLIILLITRILTWRLYKKLRKEKNNFSDKYINVTIEYGNIFNCENDNTVIIIPIDDDYTSVADNLKISKTSLHGQLIERNKKITLSDLKNNKSNNNFKGNFFKDQHFYVFPLAKLDEEYKIKLTRLEYIEKLLVLMNEIDSISNGKRIILPLIGDGYARVDGIDTSQEKLQIILDVIKIYGFKKRTNIEIVIMDSEDHKKLIKLYELEW